MASTEDVVKYAKKNTSDYRQDQLDPQKSMMLHGFSSIKQQNYGVHPLEKLEKSHFEREQYRDLSMLRAVQGKHAPLRLLAECKAASQVGHMPFLPRSNLMLDILTGRDELVTPEDVFGNTNEFCEVQLPPHLTMERQFGIL